MELRDSVDLAVGSTKRRIMSPNVEGSPFVLNH